jgi:Mlc titration factor MtfA (ptsG expression regulator)
MLGRVRRWLDREAPAFDPAWIALLERDFEHWRLLEPAELDRMQTLVSTFVHHTRWEAASGFELTEDHQVLIAAQASMLLLGLELDEYPQLTSVIVHRSTVRLHGDRAVGGGVRSSGTQHLAGQAHYRGPVVLSWAAVRRGARFPAGGQNVVYHEFAHQLDMLDGITDGTPPFGDDEAARARWVEVCTTAYDAVRAEGSSVLRAYAGTNPAEFFAVATEVFFNRPLELRDHEPALYRELRAFYRQDPAARAERVAAAAAASDVSDAPSDSGS